MNNCYKNNVCTTESTATSATQAQQQKGHQLS